MTCHEMNDVTVPYLELDLAPSRIRDVTAHLEGCAGCRTEMETVRQVLVRVKSLAVPDPGDRFWNEFPDRVRRELARERPPLPSTSGLRPPGLWTGRAVWPMALAASLLLLLGAWSLTGLFHQEPVAASDPDLPHLDEAAWSAFWDEDPDLALVDIATGLDRQAVDRLFEES